jgi:acyl carrier protein
MNDRNRCERAVRDALAAVADLDADISALRMDDNLYAQGLTSLRAVRVVLRIESDLDIELPESILSKALFSSIGDIVTAVADLVPFE